MASALRQRTASSAAPHRDRTGVEQVHIPPLVTVVEAQEVSVGTEGSQDGHSAETQITVLIFPDCSALEVNTVSLTPSGCKSLSDPSPPPDGQFGDTFQACQDLWCCYYSLRHRALVTEFAFPLTAPGKDALSFFQKYFADELLPDKVNK